MSIPVHDEPPPAPFRVGTARRVRRIFDVPAALERIPLLSRIVGELANLAVEHAARRQALDRQPSRSASWESRRSWLDEQDQLQELQGRIGALFEELDGLECVPLDALHGVVGFRTIVNGSLAYLVYRAGDQEIAFWRYRDQPRLRPVPASWAITCSAQVDAEEGLVI